MKWQRYPQLNFICRFSLISTALLRHYLYWVSPATLIHYLRLFNHNFPGGPVVKTSPSRAGEQWVDPPLGKLRSHMPGGQKHKTENRSNIVTNSVKTLKMSHIRKKILKKETKTDIKPEPEFVENIFQSSVISIYLDVWMKMSFPLHTLTLHPYCSWTLTNQEIELNSISSERFMFACTSLCRNCL